MDFSAIISSYISKCEEIADLPEEEQAAAKADNLASTFHSMFPGRCSEEEVSNLAQYTVANENSEEGWDGVSVC